MSRIRGNETLGVYLNNPGNIEWGSPWQGLVPREQSYYYGRGSAQQRRFCEFVDPASGIRAIARTLITYYDKRKANDGSKIDTVLEVIERWAPAFENNVQAYAAHVSRELSSRLDQVVAMTDELDFRDYDVMKGLVVGIIAHENAGYAYPDEVVEEGLRRAGFVKPAPIVNKNTVAGAAVPATVGVATVAPLIEPAVAALRDQQDNISSGSWVRIGLGLILVAAALYVAYGEWKKHKAGSS